MPLRVCQEEEPGMNRPSMIDVVMSLNISCTEPPPLVEPEKWYRIQLPTVFRPLTVLSNECTLHTRHDSKPVARVLRSGQGPYQQATSPLGQCPQAGLPVAQRLDTRVKDHAGT
jgi:hypothetical protein